MEYTKERLKKIICEYEFCKCVYYYQMAMVDIDKQLWNDLWNEFDEIDDDLIPVLIELNEKGYRTDGCCSGHLEQIEKYGTWQIYLSFENDYDFKDIPLEKNKNGTYKLEYKGNKKKSVQEKNEDRLKAISDLLEWAKKLPKVENNYFRIENGWVIAGDEKIYNMDDLK